MLEVAGRQCLAECLARRLMTGRGDLIDDPNAGTDLTAQLNADLNQSDIPRLQSDIVHEWAKDERVVSSVVSVQLVGPDQVTAARSGVVANPLPVPVGVLVVSGTVTDGQGPFRLVIAVTSVTATLLEVSQ
jgi:hypothetical protein